MATIKTKLEASGVSTYQQQMRQASGAVRAMSAELKTAEAQYQATGDQAAYLAEKSSILEKQLEEQKKAVAAAEKALEQVKKQYGENSAQANTWRTKLAQAKTALIQTETAIRSTDAAMDALGKDDLSGVTDGLSDVSEGAKTAKESTDALGTSVESISTKLDIETVTKGLSSITSAMEGVISKAASMGKAIWDASTDAAAWADATRDAAIQANMSTTEYQRLGYAAQFFGTSVEAVTGFQAKMNTAIGKAEDGLIAVGDQFITTTEWVKNSEGAYERQTRSWSDVMFEAIDALGMISDETERDIQAQALFGKSYKELSGIISAGREEWDRRYDEAPVVSEDTVNSLADTADAIKEMDSKLQVFKMELLNTLSPSIKTIAEAVGTLADNLTKFIQSEEGQKLLQELGQSINDIVASLTGEVDFASIVNTAKDAINGLNDAFKWLAEPENKNNVVGAITAIGAAFFGLKALTAGLNLTNTILSLRNLAGLSNAGVTPGTATGTPATPIANAAGSGTGLTDGVIMAPNGVSTWLTKIALAGAAAGLSETYAQHGQASGLFGWFRSKELGTMPTTEDVVASLSAKTGIAPYADDVIQQAGDIVDKKRQIERTADMMDAVSDMLDAIIDFRDVDETDVEGAYKLLDTLTGSGDVMKNLSDETRDLVKKYFDEDSGFGAGGPAQYSDALDLIQKIETDLNNAWDEYVEGGKTVGAGMAEGIEESTPLAVAAAARLATQVGGILAGPLAIMGGAGSTVGGGARAYNATTSLYIGNYNQNGGGDVNALAAAMAASQRQLRRGFGGRV